jgi:hypothetical protein
MATSWSGFSLEDQAKIKSELDIKREASKHLISEKFCIDYLCNVNCLYRE